MTKNNNKIYTKEKSTTSIPSLPCYTLPPPKNPKHITAGRYLFNYAPAILCDYSIRSVCDVCVWGGEGLT